MINKIVVNILPTFKQTHCYILELTEVSICANMRLKHFLLFLFRVVAITVCCSCRFKGTSLK